MSYFIAQINIHDPKTYQQYVEGFYEVFNRYQGEVVLVDDNPKAIEGTLQYNRIVVIRFPNENELHRWYDSPEYQQLARIRWKASDAYILSATDARA